MKLPRDISGAELAKALSGIGYRITRQTGSHLRLTLDTPHHTTPHHITIPAHDPLEVGTLAAILADVAANLKTNREDLIGRLFR
jgi:predicted RNA binding protein YcfA (HicA-like mRNA interferase family)